MTESESRSLTGLRGLFGAQFLGALNDHAFKTIVSLIIVDRGLADGGGAEGLSTLGALFVLPYIILAGIAGQTVDRFDTRRVLIATKVIEIPVTLLAIVALVDGRSWILIGTLALMAVQSVFFSPAKYKLLSLSFDGRSLVRANGMLELSRYTAMIAGTAIGGVALFYARQNPELVGLGLFVCSVAGTMCALSVPAPPMPVPADETATIRKPFRRTLVDLSRLRLLGTASVLTAVEMVGTTLMFVLLLFAAGVLGYSEAQTGLLAASAGIGVGAGAMLTGAVVRSAEDIRPAFTGAVIAGAAILAMPLSAKWHWLAPMAVFFAGAGGGAIVVTLNTMIQVRTPKTERGRIIAANNFLNMLGVLSASGALWLMANVINIAPTRMLHVLGSAVILMTIFLGFRLIQTAGIDAKAAVVLSHDRDNA